MNTTSISDAAKAVVRRNTEEVQGQGKFDVFEDLFAEDFVDHTTQPGTTPDKAGVRKLYTYMRQAFPDFRTEIHWQLVDGDRVTTYKTYYGTHDGRFLGIVPTHRKIHFESVDCDACAERKDNRPSGCRKPAVTDATDRGGGFPLLTSERRASFEFQPSRSLG